MSTSTFACSSSTWGKTKDRKNTVYYRVLFQLFLLHLFQRKVTHQYIRALLIASFPSSQNAFTANSLRQEILAGIQFFTMGMSSAFAPWMEIFLLKMTSPLRFAAVFFVFSLFFFAPFQSCGRVSHRNETARRAQRVRNIIIFNNFGLFSLS